jgi:hypothetical protein
MERTKADSTRRHSTRESYVKIQGQANTPSLGTKSANRSFLGSCGIEPGSFEVGFHGMAMSRIGGEEMDVPLPNR